MKEYVCKTIFYWISKTNPLLPSFELYWWWQDFTFGVCWFVCNKTIIVFDIHFGFLHLHINRAKKVLKDIDDKDKNK